MHHTKVFFPSCAVSNAKSGLCIGWRDQQSQVICVLAVVHLPLDPHQIVKRLQQTAALNGQHRLKILGPITHRGDPDEATIRQLCRAIPTELSIELVRPDPYSIPTCRLLTDCQPSTEDSLLILYDRSKILASSLPSSFETAERDSRPGTSTKHLAVSPSGDSDPGEQDRTGRSALNVDTVLSLIQEGIHQLASLKDLDASVVWKTQGVAASAIRRTLSVLVSILVSVLNLTLLPFRTELCDRLSQDATVKRLLRFTQTGRQIQTKYLNVQTLLDAYSQDATSKGTTSTFSEYTGIENRSENGCDKLRRGNLCMYLLIDAVLGVLLMWWIQRNSYPDVWAKSILSTANTTATSLQTLLQWLMGAPAGLKLNSGLARFLGQFFLYHVYLWVGYLAIIQSVLGRVIWCMSLTGCVGVSVILAVASDMVSMLSFHIYCFYVYAARIYNLQLMGLLALARLFRGKKWNVLRKRVDTCHYDVDQLFIGTLLFTILLFLLPTTLLFYAVFTLLRLAIIILQLVLSKAVDLLQRLPVYSLLLCLIETDVPVSGVRLALLQQPGNGHSNTLVMQVQGMGVFDILQVAYERPRNLQQSSGASSNAAFSLGVSLITGQLIYPWELAKTS